MIWIHLILYSKYSNGTQQFKKTITIWTCKFMPLWKYWISVQGRTIRYPGSMQVWVERFFFLSLHGPVLYSSGGGGLEDITRCAPLILHHWLRTVSIAAENKSVRLEMISLWLSLPSLTRYATKLSSVISSPAAAFVSRSWILSPTYFSAAKD